MNVKEPAPGESVAPLLVMSPARFVFAPALKEPEERSRSLEIVRVVGPVNAPAVKVRFTTLTVVVLPATLSVPPPLFITTLLKVWVADVPLID